MKNVLMTFAVLLLLVSCSTEPVGYKLYYFPVDDFSNPKVYQFVNVKQSDDIIYYAMKSIYDKGNKYLHIETYDSKYNQLESIRQRITPNGAFVDEYISIMDSIRLKMKIYSDTMMVWDIESKVKFMFEASINRPEMKNQQIIKKVRFFTGEKGNFEFDNIKYKTVELNENVFFTDGTDATSLKTTIINYANGLGIVSFEVRRPDEITKSYRLNRIISFAEWKRSQVK
jgi:hypothetical protein